MAISLKYSLTLILIFLSLNQRCIADDSDTTRVWQQLKHEYFGHRLISDNATDLLFIEVPNKVEDAAIMPITIKSLSAQTPQHHIKTLHLIVDNNPQPYSAEFHLSPKLGPINISTRIRMDNFSNVRVIAEMNDNSLHMVNRFVIASGGCSAPASKDPEKSLARLGKVKMRMREPIIGQETTVQIIVSHPNSSGMQFNKASRQFIPAHYVTDINISFNDEALLTVKTGITLSEDPSIRFTFTPQVSGTLTAKIIDSKQTIYLVEKKI
ncbi:MAG: quinoprotein dehydrogenase-associated SoxYZ-like carrier [Methylophaga sp.]|nr:quinoprotein dehydrogenase-associated SoxYZ-like carrier [Methylophaga sp.]